MAQPITITMRLDGKAQVLQGLAQVQAGIRSSFASIASVAAPLTALVGFAAVTESIRRAVTVGVEFNSTLENAKLGIAAVQRQLNPEAFQSFDDAMAAADSTLEQLKKAALESPASFTELVTGFQGITGAATAAGIPLSKQVDLTVRMSQALAGLGIRNDQLLQETRALLTGQIDKNALAAKTLGITGREIEQAKAQGKLYEFLTGKLAAFGEAGKRSQQTLTVMWSNLKDTMEQAAGVAFQPVFDQIKEMLNHAMNDVDWKGMAEQVKAFLDIGFKSFKDGTYVELISLVIRAGFELGGKAAMAALEALFKGVFSKQSLVLGMTLVNEITKSFTGAITLILAVLGSVANYLGDVFTFAFKKSVNALSGGLESAINGASKFINERFGTKFGQVSLGRENAEAPDFAKSWAENKAGRDAMQEQMNGFFDRSTEAAKELAGIGEVKPENMTAVEQLTALIGKQAALNKEIEDSHRTVFKEVTKQVGMAADLVGYEKTILKLESEVAAAKEKAARAQGNFRLTEVQKFAERKAALNMEKQKLQEIVTLLERRKAAALAAKDETLADKLDSKISHNKDKIGSVDTGLSTMGADPKSMVEQFSATFAKLQDEFGTWATQAAGAFANVFNSAISSISDGITGLIMGTMTWGQALASIGNTILTTVIQSIVQMGVRWVLTQILMATVGKSLAAASLAANVPIALAQSAIWAAPATLATISSFGGAAVAAPGEIGLSVAAVMAEGLAGFAQGGRPPVGVPSVVGEQGPELFIPHGPGTIIPADATASLLANRGGGGGSAFGGEGGTTKHEFALFMDKNDLAKHLDTHIEAKVMNLMDRHVSRYASRG